MKPPRWLNLSSMWIVQWSKISGFKITCPKTNSCNSLMAKNKILPKKFHGEFAIRKHDKEDSLLPIQTAMNFIWLEKLTRPHNTYSVPTSTFLDLSIHLPVSIAGLLPKPLPS